MSALTVFAAPAGELSGVREALTDWSARGLIDTFIWVEQGMLTRRGIKAVRVSGGRSEAVTLERAAGSGEFDRARLCVLVRAGAAGIPLSEAVTISEALENAVGRQHVLRVRAVVAFPGENELLDALAYDGWHNLVLAPEESADPGKGSVALHPSNDPYDVGIPAAATCAGLLGLWKGAGSSPLDEEEMLPGEQARLVRSYYRNLDTGDVETALRSRIISTADGLPLPSSYGTTNAYIDDAALAGSDMANQLWARHQGILKGHREPFKTQETKNIGAWAALKMMFSFLWAAVKNAPRSWAQRVGMRLKAEAASRVHGIVFGGTPTQYRVIVNGVTANGIPASWLDIRDAAIGMDKALESAGMPREHEAHADMSQLWQDYAAGALTLADAGERVAGMPPVQIGAQRAVLRQAGQAVPATGRRFADIPQHLAATVELEGAAPYDVLAIQALENRLQEAAQDPNQGVAASSTLQSLRRWRAQHHESYASRVGERLGGSLHQVAAEVRELLERIRRTGDADEMLASVLAGQKRAGLIQKIILAVFFVAVATVAGLGLGGVISATTAWSIGGGLVALWLIAAMIAFLRSQRELFRLLNARNTMLSNDEVTRINLRHALRDLRRLSDAYSQYLAWTHIIGTVLHEPFGRAPARAESGSGFICDLPANAKVGAAKVRKDAVDMASARLRSQVYAVGWLGRPWENTILNAAGQLGARGYELSGRPLDVFKQAGDGEQSLLPAWTRALDAQGIDGSHSTEMWEGILANLREHESPIADDLLDTVTEVGDRRLDETTLDRFMGGLEDSGNAASTDYFDALLLTDGARTSGAARVAKSIRFETRNGLGRSAGLLQLSGGIPAHQFLVSRQESGLGGGLPGEDPLDEFQMPSGPVF